MNLNPNNNDIIDQTGIIDATSGDPASATVRADPRATAIDRRRGRRGTRVAVTTLALGAVLGGVFSPGSIAADDGGLHVRSGQPAPPFTTGAENGDLWDRIRRIGLPRQWWAPVATAMGLTPRGEWISADGLTWEHLDGRRIVVATPRTPTRLGDQTCS